MAIPKTNSIGAYWQRILVSEEIQAEMDRQTDRQRAYQAAEKYYSRINGNVVHVEGVGEGLAHKERSVEDHGA